MTASATNNGTATTIGKGGKLDQQDSQNVQEQLKGLVSSVYEVAEDDERDTVDILAQALEPVIEGVIPRKKSPARVRVGRLLARVALGSTWRDALAAENAKWAEMACLTIHPGLFALSEACKAIG